MKRIYKFLMLILGVTIILGACNLNNDEMEKEKIYSTIKDFDNWYNKECLIKTFQPEERWTFFNEISQDFPFSKNANGYRKYLSQRIEELNKLDFFTKEYLNIINYRFNNDTLIVNEGILFTNHPFGDCIPYILVDRSNMDYMLTRRTLEWNPFLETNENLNEEEFIQWHKERIQIISKNKAEYKVMYSEVGYMSLDRALSFFVIEFIKVDEKWKIDNIRIEEVEEEVIKAFHEENVERRGYYSNN